MNKIVSRFVRILSPLTAIAILGGGCASYHEQTKGVREAIIGGNTKAAADALGKHADTCDKKDAVIFHLEAGAAYRSTGDYTNSNRHLENAGTQIDKFEEQAKTKVGLEFLGLMTNQANLPYEGRSYDSIMLYTYKVLNDLALGEIEKARPEINHAYQCQQDAVEENKRRIEKAAEAGRKNQHADITKASQNNPNFQQQLAQVTPTVEGFKAYADYVNPFTVYLDGLYFLYAGVDASDLEHARKSLTRIQELIGSNKFVQADLQLIENSGTTHPSTPCTYVIFETGRVASRNEIKINLPFIVQGRVVMVTAALPKLEFHNDQAQFLTVKAGDLEEKTATIANLDSIVALDFKNEWPIILTKTMIASSMKAASNYAIAKNDKYGFTSLIKGLVDVLINIADTRSWTTLPKEFQVARIPTPADRKLVLSTTGTVPVDVAIADGIINVVYVKSIITNSPLAVSQFKLK